MKINLNNIKISTSTLIALTSIIDKMGIADQLKNMDKPTTEELGTEIIVLFMTNLYKAQNQIYDFIIEYKDLMEEPTVDEDDENYEKEYKKNYQLAVKQAKKYDFIELIKEMLHIDGITDFLK